MDDEFVRERARAVRSMADNADPFTKKRLLELADRYEGINQGRPLTPYELPMLRRATDRVLPDHSVAMWVQVGASQK